MSAAQGGGFKPWKWVRSLRERVWSENRGEPRESPGSMGCLGEGVGREAHKEKWKEKAEG